MRFADQVWALVRVWSDWAGDKPPSRRYWYELIEEAQPARAPQIREDNLLLGGLVPVARYSLPPDAAAFTGRSRRRVAHAGPSGAADLAQAASAGSAPDARRRESSPPFEADIGTEPVPRPSSAGHAFVSYVREDSGEVDALQRMLEAAGVRVWRDTSDLWPGEDWRARIRDAITRNALVFIACISHRSVGRQTSYQNEELALAIDQLRQRRPDVPWLIPVRFDDCAIPDYDIGGGRTLASLQRADLFGDSRHESASRLVDAVLRILGPNQGESAATGSSESGSSRTLGRRAPMRGSRRRHSLIWGSEVPFRNPHFVGREVILEKLRTQLTSDASDSMRQALAVLQGLGGIGKTELAAEYAHRYSSDYDVVWWIRADQEDSIRSALVGLGRQFGLQGFRPEERDYSSRLVLDALRSGEPYERWLLIFDDVTRPGIIGRYVPPGPGHVIITSRLTRWQRELRTDGIQLTEFALGETVRLLRDRIPQLAYYPDAAAAAPAAPSAPELEDARRQGDAERLAQTLGNLPLAAEHAAAYIEETGYTVDKYIAAFNRNAHELFSREADLFATQVAVETTWSLSRENLTPEARALFQILAFFPAEPISEEVLIQPGLMQGLPSELAAVLCSNTEFRRAGRELARFSLAKINGIRNVIQVHNVVQAVTRGRIEREDPAAAATFRDTVHALPNAAR